MQPPLPLCGLMTPSPLAWENVASDYQVEAVAMLARLMAQLVQPEPAEEEQTND